MTASENEHGKTDTATMTRRHFIAGTGASVLAFTVLKPGLLRGAEANSKIDIGLIGCGNRGKWIADLFQKNGGYNIVAVADYFQDHADEAGAKFNVPVAAAALQFSLRDPRIVSTIVGISRPERVADTVALATQVIPEPLWAELASVERDTADPGSR